MPPMTSPDEKATLLTRKTAYAGRFIKLDLERVALPGGHVTELEMIRHPGASCIVPFVSPDEILLIRQYRHAAGGFLLELPAGVLDDGEEAETCAGRELEEETGFSAGRLEKLGSILTTPGFTDERIHLFAAHELTECGQRLEADEVLSVLRVGFDEAQGMVRRGDIDENNFFVRRLKISAATGRLRKRRSGE